MKKKKFIPHNMMIAGFLMTWTIIILAFGLAVSQAEAAKGLCKYNAKHGWHIVGAGKKNSHWYPTQEACLIALNGPAPHYPPTATPVGTQIPGSTQVPQSTPTPGGVVDPHGVPTAYGAGINCQGAWDKIQGKKYKDVGYRFFDNPEHAWCRVWLRNHYGIDYEFYKFNHFMNGN